MASRLNVLLAAAAVVGLGFLVVGRPPSARAQEEAAPAPRPGPGPVVYDAGRIWNFHFEGKKERGDFLELAQLDAKGHRGQALVLTHLDLRLPQSMRLQLVEFHREPGARETDRNAWKKIVRRGEAFSLGWLDSTSKTVVAPYASLVGLRFDPFTRPSLEVTAGSGEISVYAEGYWAEPGAPQDPPATAPTKGPITGEK